MQLSGAVRDALLDSIETAIGASPTLQFRDAAMPANCAAADAGTLVGEQALPSDFMAAASGGSKAKSGTWQDTAANASGIIRHFRIKQGATCHLQGLVSEAWQASHAYIANEQVHNGGNVYICTSGGTSAGSGGPTGTGTGITDGGVTWDFVQTGVDMALDKVNVNVGQPITTNAFTLTAPNG